MLDRLTPQVLAFDFDRDLLEWVKTSNLPKFSIYPFPFKALVAGRGSNLAKEMRLPLCMEDNIPVYRRMGGGCSVFLDPGNLIVSIAFPARGFSGIQRLFNQCNGWLIKGFNAMGLTGLYQDGVSDLVINNCKVGGSCFYRSKGFGYYSAAILVSPDLRLMEKYLPLPPRQPGYRKNRSHREFVTRLDTHITGMTITDFEDGLREALVLDQTRFHC
jgi:lipoate-protein ligase A